MLQANVLQCIRETIEAELRQRNRGVRDRAQGSDRKIAATQGSLSGAAIAARAQIACDELTVRAEIIWSIIQRCHKSFSAERGDSLLSDLQHQINELVSAEAVIVFNHVDGGASALYPTQLRTHIDDALTVRRIELITKLKNEARFYVQDIKQPPISDPSGITIHGNVGSVQTGDYAQAHIHINADGGAGLAGALEKLRAAIMEAAEMTADQRDESVEVVNDLIVAARAPKPNGPKLIGLMSGLASTIRTVASLQGAWEFVRDHARMMGLPI
jgi:hypothetical protein